ncbi:methyltransferase [Ruminococcaceae bacterium OttesenSCG-928-L11]|nr:methyltransferase [Ruminococcaceae bacterium OttesenSCG-928-L11]
MLAIAINDIPLTLQTAPELFSPGGLDAGTAAMLSCINLLPSDKVLDLGCGYGVVGIYAAKCIGAERVTMCDIDPLAVEQARQNAALNNVPDVKIVQSDGFRSIDDFGFTVILSNPPYHADFSVPKHFIEKGFNRLAIGGRMLMVTKRRDWYKNKFISIFGGVKIQEVDGYFVFIAEKRTQSFASKKSR